VRIPCFFSFFAIYPFFGIERRLSAFGVTPYYHFSTFAFCKIPPRTILPPGYGRKSNLPDNFDPNIGSKPRKSASSTSVDTTVTFNPTPPSPSQNSHSSTPIRSPTPPIIMPVGSFPPLNFVKDVKEFDGNPEKLNDFLASVEGNMAAYNIPLSQGGFVAGNVDDGWQYVTAAVHAQTPVESRSNYDYGRRYFILLAERFMGTAREWWINRKMANEPAPNCWVECPGETWQVPEVEEVSFRKLIVEQFSNPMDLEVALSELKGLKWNPNSESLSHFKTRTTSLFHRAGIDRWIFQRPYILAAFDTDMQRALRLPSTAKDLWNEAQSYWITEQAIKTQSSSKHDTGKPSSSRKMAGSNSSSSGGGNSKSHLLHMQTGRPLFSS